MRSLFSNDARDAAASAGSWFELSHSLMNLGHSLSVCVSLRYGMNEWRAHDFALRQKPSSHTPRFHSARRNVIASE